MKRKIFKHLAILLGLSFPSLSFATQSIFSDPSAGSCTDVAPSNTGNGTCSVSAVTAFVSSETFTFTATSGGPVATFTVSSNVTGAHNIIVSGSSQSVVDSYGFTKFTITLSDGGTPYIIGDNFQVILTAGTELKKSNFDLFTLSQVCSNGCSSGASLTSPSIISSSANPASAGSVRLAVGDVINWRNNANSADLSLGVSSGDVITAPSFGSTNFNSGASGNAGSGMYRMRKTDFIAWRNNGNTADITITLNGSDNINTNSPMNITGVTSGVTAASGIVGEFLTQQRAQGSTLSLTTAVPANLLPTPLTLTAGDWEINAVVCWNGGNTTIVNDLIYSISLTSATISAASTRGVPSTGGEYQHEMVFGPSGAGTGGSLCYPSPSYQVLLTSSTTYYLVVSQAFTISSMSAHGWIGARRLH